MKRRLFSSVSLVLCLMLVISQSVIAADNTYSTYISEVNTETRKQFSEGLCGVRDTQTQRWGFIDKTGNWMISPQFKSVENFNDGYCAVLNLDNEYLLIDRNGSTVYKGAKSYQKRGNYGVIELVTSFSDKKYILVDEKLNNILPSDILLDACYNAGNDSYTPNVYFECDKIIYNYKGDKVSDYIYNKYGYSYENYIRTLDNYLIYHDVDDNKLVTFDLNGNCLSKFPNGSYTDSWNVTIYTYGNVVAIDDRISKVRTLYDVKGNNILTINDENVDIASYYNKYIVVSKIGKTSALYKTDGTLLVDFGKWDGLAPASISDRMIVRVGNKYGIANFNGNVEIPLEYDSVYTTLYNNGKTAAFQKGKDIVLVDLLTLNTKTLNDGFTLAYGNNRILISEDYDIHHLDRQKVSVIDAQMNTIVSDIPAYIGTIDDSVLREGIVIARNRTGTITECFVFNDGGGVKVELNNMLIPFDTEPIIQNGRTLVPLRAIFEALGAAVNWDNATQTVTATKDDIVIQMQIGNHIMNKNKEEIALDVTPQIVDGRTLVPVRAIAESFNIIVDWNGYSNTVQLFEY